MTYDNRPNISCRQFIQETGDTFVFSGSNYFCGILNSQLGYQINCQPFFYAGNGSTSIRIGLNTNTNSYSTAIGYNSCANGLRSISIGCGSAACCNDSVSIGDTNVSCSKGSSILGGNDNVICSNVTGVTLIGNVPSEGNTFCLDDSAYNNYVVVPNLAILNIPSGTGCYLCVDGTGKIYKTAGGGGGSGFTIACNGLTSESSTTVKLGGTLNEETIINVGAESFTVCSGASINLKDGNRNCITLTTATMYICAGCGVSGATSGNNLEICAGGSYTSGIGNAGNLIISAGDCNGATGLSGCVILSPGKSNNIIVLGKATNTSSYFNVCACGSSADVGLLFEQKGNGFITIGQNTGNNPIDLYGCRVGIAGGVIQVYCNSTICYTGAADGCIIGATPNTARSGHTLTIKGGCACSSGDQCGGKLVLCGGAGFGTCPTGRIIMPTLPAKTSETCGIYIDASGNLSYGVISGGTGGGSGFTIACNGLTSEGSTTVKLGGALDENTTICGTDVNILRLEATGDYGDMYDEITPYLEFFGDSAITLRIDKTRGSDYYETGLQIDDSSGCQMARLSLGNITGNSSVELSSCPTNGLMLFSTNCINISGATYLNSTPPTGACTDSALTWDSGTTAIRKLPIIEEWVSSESELEYMGQKYNYPTHSIFMSDVATCTLIPNYIFCQNINLDNVTTTLLFNIPTGKRVLFNRAKLIMTKDATPTDFTISVGNNQSGTYQFCNLVPVYSIDDVLAHDTYELPICSCSVGIDTGNNCPSGVYFYVQTGSTFSNNLCAHLLLEGFLY